MEIHLNPFFSLFISFSLLSLTITTTSFSPIDHYLINCGSPKPTSLNNRHFQQDSLNSGKAIIDPNPNPNSPSIYHTAKAFTNPSKYVFVIKDKGTHLVRLHFHPFNSSKSNLFNAHFHVSLNGYVLLYNFNTQKSVIKDYMIWVDVEKLVIIFTPAQKFHLGFVSAIEVISASKDLIADVGQFVSNEKNERIDGLMKNALETVYRVNVGGFKVTPFNDSLWRTWLPDDEFLKSSNGSRRVYFGGRIKYRLGGASREVGPDNVYNTARVISSSDNSVPKLNITWAFGVTEGYKYLVRMHFCDIASVSLWEIYFNVYVNGNLAYENLDLSSITGMLASPFYADFVVDGDSSGVITVAVGPSNMSLANAIDAMLNGVEIMKMNNSLGSLDGEVSVKSILKCSSSGNVSSLVPFIAVICLLLAAYGVTQKRRIVTRDSVGWSPLPVDVSEVDFKRSNQLSVRKV